MDVVRRLLKWGRCRRVSAHLVDLAEGVLPEGERGCVERHLSGCRDCREGFEALRETPSRLREALREEGDEDFWLQQRQQIMRSIRRLPERQAARLRSSPRRWALVLAPVTALLLVIVGYRISRAPMPGARDVVRSVSELDAETIVALADVSSALIPEGSLADEGEWIEDQLARAPARRRGAEDHWGAEAPGIADLSERDLDDLVILMGFNLG